MLTVRFVTRPARPPVNQALPYADAPPSPEPGWADRDRAESGTIPCAGETLDRLTRTAARAAGVERAALSTFHEGRQRVISAVGFPAGGELDARDGLCARCAESRGVLAIPDVAAHPVWGKLPAPAALGVRGYLGAPVELPDTNATAALCVLSDVPRDWTPDDLAAMTDLAAVASEAIRAERLVIARAAAERRARRSEERFRDIAQSAGEYLWEIDADSRFTFLTEPGERVYGRPGSEILGKRPWDLYDDPAEAARVEEWFDGVRGRRERFRDLLRRSRRPDGEARWVRLSGSPVLGEDGALLGYRGVGLDVTAEKLAEQKARKAAAEAAWAEAAAESARRDRHDLLERFISQAPAAVAMFDRRMRYVTHSRLWLEVHGMPPATTLVGNSHYEVFPSQPDRWREVHEACLAGETRRATADPFTRSDGTAGWLDWHVEPWTDGGGNVGGIVILCSDVTTRQCGISRLQSAVDAADIGTWLWDFRTGVLLADGGLRNFFGLPPEAETVGVDPDRLYDPIHPDDQPRVAAAHQRAYETGRFDTEYRVRANGGPVRWLAARGKITRDEDDRPQCFHGAVVDITERKRVEEELREAKSEAEASNRAKSEFLANMSHELRTPLTAILGFADLIAETAGPVRSAAADRPAGEATRGGILSHVRTIRRNGEHLLRLINDVLDLAKVEAGKLAVDRVPFPVRHLTEELADLMRPKAEAQGLTLSVKLAPTLADRAALGDPTRLRQVLLNLLGNAVKFTDAGGVELTVRPADGPAAGRRGPTPWLEFAVTDTGCGIAADQLERLFAPFEQADASTTRKYGGTGLGLSISRRLAERMGGSLTAESEPGAGATFRLRVPAPPAPVAPFSGPLIAEAPAGPLAREPRRVAPPEPPPAPPPKPLVGRRVLLAEDIEDSRRLITFLLRKAGAEVEAVGDGRAAVDRVWPPRGAVDGRAAGPSEGGFDVILMDMQMPVLDGYDAARELRDRGYDGPIVALTAHAMDGDAAACLAAGCDAYAAKPIGREDLVNCVLRAAAGRFDADAPPDAPAVGTRPAAELEPAPY